MSSLSPQFQNEIQTPQESGESGTTPSVRICNDVLDELRFNGSWNKEKVACGILLGIEARNAQAEWNIVGFIGGGFFSDLSEFHQNLIQNWKSLKEQIQDCCPEKHRDRIGIVGWYASWPDSSHEPDQKATMLHNSFFPLDSQFALWIQPDDSLRCLQPRGDQFVRVPLFEVNFSH